MSLCALEEPKAVATPQVPVTSAETGAAAPGSEIVVVVPAQEGFEQSFLGEHCWHAIRVAGGKLYRIKYITAFQTAPSFRPPSRRQVQKPRAA